MDYPRRLGKYEIINRIGAGGMAEVFRARRVDQPNSKKYYAIKQLGGAFTKDPLLVSMFVDEARLAAQLRHHAIVNLIEFGTSDTGQVYMVMEYIDGRDLRWCLSAAARAQYWLPVEFSLTIVRAICSALEYAHQARTVEGMMLNLVHRDVSHSNVFLSRRGEVKLADFGIARAEGRRSKTRTGLVKGKLGYLSPEQVRAEPLDGRSDLFSAGVVLWELMTQRRMFVARTEFRTMVAVCTEPRVAPSVHRNGIPSELDKLCLKGVQIRKTERYQSAAEFGNAIDKVAATLGYELSETMVAGVLQYLSDFTERPAETPTPSLTRNLSPAIPDRQVTQSDLEEDAPVPLLERYESAHDLQSERLKTPSDNFFAIDWMEPEDHIPPEQERGEVTDLDAVDLLASRVPNSLTDSLPATPLPSPSDRLASVTKLERELPIFVRGNDIVQTCTSLEELLLATRPNQGKDIVISANMKDWMPLPHFNMLADFEYASFGHDIKQPVESGEHQGLSLLSLLCELALNGFTGRLIVDRPNQRYVLLLEAGAIVGLSGSNPQSHLLSAMTASGQIASAHSLMSCFHEVILRRTPLLEILETKHQLSGNTYQDVRAACARELFRDLLGSGVSNYSLEATDGWPGLKYMAGNCIQWVIPLSAEAWQNIELLHRLKPRLDRAFSLMPGFPLVARMLRITQESAPIVQYLGQEKTLRSVLDKFDKSSKTYGLALRLITVFEATNAILLE